MKTLMALMASRKVLTALATILTAILAQKGLAIPEETVLGILGVGASVILGIAWEDAAEKSGV